jgi:hypothetical protein
LQVRDLFFRPLFAFFIIELKSRKVLHDTCQICSSGNEDKLATGKRSLALPGLGGFR